MEKYEIKFPVIGNLSGEIPRLWSCQMWKGNGFVIIIFFLSFTGGFCSLELAKGKGQDYFLKLDGKVLEFRILL